MQIASPTTLSKKLVQLGTGHQLYLCTTLGTPFHNLKNRKFQVFIDGNLQEGDHIKLLGSFSCLCEPSSVISTRNSSLPGNSSSLTDTFIDPLTRIITIQSAITPKQVVPSIDGKKLSIKLGSFGKNPGKSQIKFVTLVFEISFNGQFYYSYITMKTHRGIGIEERGCTNKESCFISDAVQNQEDEFIEALFYAASHCRPSTRKQTPQKITTLKGAIIPEEGFVDFLEGKTEKWFENILLKFLEDPIEDYPNPPIDVFSDITCTKIHFDFGPKEGGQPNTLYLSFKDSSKTDIFKLLQNHSQSIGMYFVPQEHPEVLIALPQIVHITCNRIGNQVAIHHTTSPILSNFEGDALKTWVFLTINNEIIDGKIEYTFEKSIQQETEFSNFDDQWYKIGDIYTPFVTIYNIGQFAKQQYQQSNDKFQDVGDFIANFQKQFGKIIDVFGCNFAGFLKTNNFAVSGITFEEVICPDISNEKLVTIRPAEVRKEEKSLRADEATNMIVKSIQMIENYSQTLALKKRGDSKQGEEYAVINAIAQKQLKQLEANFGERHARTDKPPHLNLKFVIYDAAALPSQEAQNITPKLKVALFFAKFVISFDENTQAIFIEDQEEKKNFLHQVFYYCDLYTFRKSDEIDNFLIRLYEFNCAWNCSQLYDEKNSNTGHYVISVLKYLNIWEPTALWAKFAVNVCERKPLEKHVTIYPDFFHMDSKNSIPAMLTGAKAAECPKLKERLLGYMNELSDAPFKYDFSGYSDNTDIEARAARTELEFMCELLKECGESYLRNMEDGVRTQRLLKKIMQTNYGQSLSNETWQYLEGKPLAKTLTAHEVEELKKLERRHSFLQQRYNIPNFFNLIKSTNISEALEIKDTWQRVISKKDTSDTCQNYDSKLQTLCLKLTDHSPTNPIDISKVLISDSVVDEIRKQNTLLPTVNRYYRLSLWNNKKERYIAIKDIGFLETIQAIYDCNIYTVKKSFIDEIDYFLIRLAEFHCAWNCNTVLKYLNIWEPIMIRNEHQISIPTYRFQIATGEVYVHANGGLSLELTFKEKLPLTGEIILWSNMKDEFITLNAIFYSSYNKHIYIYNFSFKLDTYDQEKFLIYLGTTEKEHVLVGHIDDKLEFQNETTLTPDSWYTYSINPLF